MRKFFAKVGEWLERPWVMRVGVGLAVVMVLLRFALMGAEMWDHPDPNYFQAGAVQLAETGGLGDYYYAVFPYMTGYISMLAGFFSLFGVGGFAVVLLNVVFELVGVVALYFLVKLASGSAKKALWAGVAWCFNPFHFIYSGLAMPVVAFDSMLMVVALVAYLAYRGSTCLAHFGFFSALRTRRMPNTARLRCSKENPNCTQTRKTQWCGWFWTYVFLLGAVLALAGWFRPVAPVLLIALGMWWGWGLVRDKFDGWWKILLGFGVVLAVFVGGTRLELLYAERVTGVAGVDNYAGWSVFVGSNEANNGGWNQADADVFWDDYLLNGYSIEEANDEVMQIGIERYRDRSFGENMAFLGRKVGRFVGNIPETVHYYAGNWGVWAEVMLVWGWVWVGACVVLFVVGVVRGWRELLKGGLVLFLVLTVLGLFSSGLLVEVMDRYAIPILCAVYLVGVVRKDD